MSAAAVLAYRCTSDEGPRLGQQTKQFISEGHNFGSVISVYVFAVKRARGPTERVHAFQEFPLCIFLFFAQSLQRERPFML